MNISFEHNLSGLLIFLVIILAGGISYFLYFRNNENAGLSDTQKTVLSLVRFSTLSLILLFLLSPLIKREKKIKQNPILAVAIDNSQSIQAYLPELETIRKTLDNKFTDGYDLQFWSFGEKTMNSDVLNGIERRSDYGLLIKSIQSTYSNKNLGALILIGDGIYNQGQNPENLISRIKFPVYSIGIGDTTSILDASVRNVRVNKTTFLKNKFPVEIELKFDKLNNQIAYIEIENKKKIVYSGNVPIDSDDDFKLEFLNLEATDAGLQHYKIKIKHFDNESNVKNNEYEFVIQVLENRQKILIVSDGPHPDLGAIRNSLEELQNYEIRLIAGIDLPDSLSNYSLIVLNQLPTIRNSANVLLRKVQESRLPVLFIIGPNTLTDQLNSMNFGINIAFSQNSETVQPIFNPNFSLFVLSDELKSVFATAPPLTAPFGNTTTGSMIQSLAFQGIKGIETNKTLLAFGTEKGRKTGFILGEGIWRWRLSGFRETGSHEAFNELVHKSIQYLALKENEDNFNVYYPAIYQETDELEFTAELFNDSYELVNTPDVSIQIMNDSLREFTYLFDRVNDFYRLNAGNLNPGDYTFIAETNLGNQRFTETGKFSILKNEIETQNFKADFKLLYQLAHTTGGQFYTIENYGTLLDSLKADKQITVQQFRQTNETELINLKTFFFLLVILLGTEWFFRKYWGIY